MSQELCRSACEAFDASGGMHATASPSGAAAVLEQMGAVTTIDWTKVWTWFVTYGVPAALKAIQVVLPLLLNGGLTWANAVQIIEAILAGLHPVPTPGYG